jgi:hypothetical protein
LGQVKGNSVVDATNAADGTTVTATDKKIIRMHSSTYFLAMVGVYDPPEHDGVIIDNALPVGAIFANLSQAPTSIPPSPTETNGVVWPDAPSGPGDRETEDERARGA